MQPIQQLLATQYVTNAAATVYTSPYALGTNSVVIITGLIIANTDSSAHTFTLYNLPSGGTAAGGNTIIGAASIPANTSWFQNNPDGLIIIPAAGFLQALADANSHVTFTVFGREVV